jgi:hypothetical protein
MAEDASPYWRHSLFADGIAAGVIGVPVIYYFDYCNASVNQPNNLKKMYFVFFVTRLIVLNFILYTAHLLQRKRAA